jgi:hypothetical protein
MGKPALSAAMIGVKVATMIIMIIKRVSCGKSLGSLEEGR